MEQLKVMNMVRDAFSGIKLLSIDVFPSEETTTVHVRGMVESILNEICFSFPNHSKMWQVEEFCQLMAEKYAIKAEQITLQTRKYGNGRTSTQPTTKAGTHAGRAAISEAFHSACKVAAVAAEQSSGAGNRSELCGSTEAMTPKQEGALVRRIMGRVKERCPGATIKLGATWVITMKAGTGQLSDYLWLRTIATQDELKRFTFHFN